MSRLAFERAVAVLGNFRLHIGSIVVGEGLTLVQGPNGSGKSTFLRAILGLVPLASGARLVAADTRLGVVPQNYRDALLPWKRGWDNLALFDSAPAPDALRWLEATGFARNDLQKMPYQLSGGQSQRLVFIREMTMGAHVIALDEPFSGLDKLSAKMAADWIAETARQGVSVVLCTHQLPSDKLSRIAGQSLWCERQTELQAEISLQQ